MFYAHHVQFNNDLLLCGHAKTVEIWLKNYLPNRIQQFTIVFNNFERWLNLETEFHMIWQKTTVKQELASMILYTLMKALWHILERFVMKNGYFGILMAQWRQTT